MESEKIVSNNPTINLHNSTHTTQQPKKKKLEKWAEDQIRKMWYIYTMEYYSAIKRNEILPFAATWIELETLTLSEVSQKEKDKYRMISWNLIMWHK